MTDALRELGVEYAAALRAYAGDVGEQALQRAYEIGRAAITVQGGALDIASIHQEALRALLEESPGQDLRELMTRTSTFLLESLAAVEMATRGFRESLAMLSERADELTATNRRLESEIAERTEIEQALRDSEQRLQRSERLFRSLIENSSDIVTILNADGTIRYESPSVVPVLGYNEQELVGQNAFAFVHPEDAPDLIEAFQTGIRIPGFSDSRTFRFRHKDGGWRILESVGNNLSDVPGVGGILITSRDITEKVQMQERLRDAARQREEVTRHYAAAVQRAQEEERRRIARELHDDICQRLTALRLQVNLVEDGAAGLGSKGKKQLKTIKERLDGVITDVRRMSAHLRPIALDLFGLVTSIRILCEEVQKSHKVAVSFASPENADQRYDEQTDIALYRIAQEALQNAVTHSGARAVKVALVRQGEFLVLSVHDNGKGFAPSREAPKASTRTGSGLVNMRERAELLGGTFEIDSLPRTGTTVRIALPSMSHETRQENSNSIRR